MPSFPSIASTSPSQTLHSLDPNSSSLNSAGGLRHRQRNGSTSPADASSFRGGAGAKRATNSTLMAPPPRSSLCLQMSAADAVTPIKKSGGSAGGMSMHPHNPFSGNGLFPPSDPASFVSSAVGSSTTSSSSSSSSSWVCVYGIDASIQELVLDRFASYGRIVHQKSVGVNAIAIRYDNPLSAGKALCQTRFCVRGHYCGTFPMSDNDTSLIAMETPGRVVPNGGSTSIRGAPPAPVSLFAPATATAASNARSGSAFGNANDADNSGAVGSNGDDIFLHRKPHRTNMDPPNESLCLRVIRWLVGLD